MELTLNKAPNITEKATYTEKIFHKCLQIICSHFKLIRGVKNILETFCEMCICNEVFIAYHYNLTHPLQILQNWEWHCATSYLN